jgi:hypothetical protein
VTRVLAGPLPGVTGLRLGGRRPAGGAELVTGEAGQKELRAAGSGPGT